MSKNLPIKIFKKRDVDKQLNNLPVINNENVGKSFRLSASELKKRSDNFKRYFSKVDRQLSRKVKTQVFLPTLCRVRINESALAKYYRGEIVKLFNVNHKNNVIGLIGEDTLLLKIDNQSDLVQIQEKVADLSRMKIALSAVDEVKDFNPLVLDVDKSTNDFKIRLINYGDPGLNEIAMRGFEKMCKELDAKFEKLNYSKELILYHVTEIKHQSLLNSNESESIYSISKMPIIQLSSGMEPVKMNVSVKNPEQGNNYFKIGVFDEAISDIEHLKNWKNGRYSAFEDGFYDNTHGTFVAGILNYGDQLENSDWTGTPPFLITEAIILPNKKYGYIDEYMLVNHMREAIKAHPEIKVWNFSIGHNRSIDDSQYSDFARFLDELQDEFNILIVKAAGNCINFSKGAPRGRITEASESIRSVVVGSIAHSKNATDIAEINHPSPFSMKGPGVADVIKPDLVHYGGNAGLNGKSVVYNGVKSFSQDGSIVSDVGTSYSTPRVAGLLSELAGTLKEDFNSTLLRAMIIHSAKHPKEFNAPIDERINHIGFGLPIKTSDIIYNDPDEITLILMDTIDKGGHIKIMDFPFPSSLVADNHFYGQIKITLAVAPSIDSTQGVEYIQSGVDVALGTYEKKIEIDTKKNKTKRNLIDIADPQNLLLPSLYSKVKQRAAVDFDSERFLKSYSNQFIPVKKWCIDLEELTDSNRVKWLNKDRSWFLKLEAAFRANYELHSGKSGTENTEFAIIISIKDTRKKGKVYNEVSGLLSKFNFIHENIKVNEHIRVK